MITSIAITFFWKGLTWRPHWVDDDLAEVEQNCHLNFGKDMKKKHLKMKKMRQDSSWNIDGTFNDTGVMKYSFT